MDTMKGTSLQSQLNSLLHDLEVAYLDLVGGKLWAGINATPHKSFFFVGNTNNDDDMKELKALAAKSNIPWDEWVKKYAKCHHQNPKAKAFLSAFSALFTKECDNDNNENNENILLQENDIKLGEDENIEDPDDLQSFLSMIGSSLNEQAVGQLVPT